MGEAFTGESRVEIGGETYTLIYTVDALCQLEEALDLQVDIISLRLARPARMSFLRKVWWAGLLDRHGLDLKDAGELMGALLREKGAHELGLAIARAYFAAFPKPEAASGAENPPKAPQKRAGTGKSSTGSGSSSGSATSKVSSARRRS